MSERIGLDATLDLDQWSRNVEKYLRDVDRMDSVTGKIAHGMVTSFQDLGKSIVTVTSAVAGLATALVAVGGRELAEWTVEGIKGAIDLEQRVADVASVLNLTTQEAEPLKQLIDELSLDPTLVVSTQEAADAIQMLARNGLDMQQIMDGAARSTVLLANATGGSFATAADVATDMLAQFNLGVDELATAADFAQGVVNNSKLTIDDFRLALAQGGGAFGAFTGGGIETLKDFAAIAAATAPFFSSGSDLGTALKVFTTRLVPASNAAADAMRDLGLFSGLTDKQFKDLQRDLEDVAHEIANLDPTSKNYAEKLDKLTKKQAELRKELIKGNNAFFDAQGNMKSATEIAAALSQAVSGLSEMEMTDKLTEIFGQDAVRMAIALAKVGDGLAGVRAEVTKLGSAEAAAATRMSTLNAQLTILGDRMEAIQRKSGEQFTGLLAEIVKWLNELVSQQGERVIALFGRLADMFEVLWQRSQPLIDRFLPVFLDNIEALVNYLVDLVIEGDRANEWLDKLHPNLRAVVDFTWKVVDAYKAFRERLAEFIEKAKEALAPILDWIDAHVTLEDVLLTAALAVGAFLAPLGLWIAKMALVGTTVAAAIAAVREAWQTNAGGIQDIVRTLIDVLDRAFEVMTGVVTALGADLRAQLEQFGVEAPDIVEQAMIGISLALGRIHPALAAVGLALTGLKMAWEADLFGMKTISEDIWAGIKAPFDGMLNALQAGDWSGAWSAAQTVMVNALEVMKSKTPEFIDPWLTFMQKLVLGDWSAAWSAAQTAVVTAIDAMIAKTPEFIDPWLEIIRHLVEGEWSSAWATAQEAFAQALGEMKRVFDRTLGDLPTFIEQGGAGGKIVRWFLETFPMATEATIAVVEDLQDTYGRFFAEVAQQLDQARLFWEKHGFQIMAIIDFTLGQMIDDLMTFTASYLDVATAMSNALQGNWQEAWDNIAGIQRRFSEASQRETERSYRLMEALTKTGTDRLTRLLEEQGQAAKDAYMAHVRALTDSVGDETARVAIAFETAGQDAMVRFLQAVAVDGATEEQINTFVRDVGDLVIAVRGGFVTAGEESIMAFVRTLAERHGIRQQAAEEFAMSVIGGIKVGLEAGQSEVSAAADGLIFALEDAFQGATQLMALAGRDAAAAFADAVAADQAAPEKVEAFFRNLNRRVAGVQAGYYELGEASVVQYAAGLAASLGLSETAAEDFARAVLAGLEREVAAGAPAVVEETEQAVEQAAQAMATDIGEATRQSARAMTEQVGKEAKQAATTAFDAAGNEATRAFMDAMVAGGIHITRLNEFINEINTRLADGTLTEFKGAGEGAVEAFAEGLAQKHNIPVEEAKKFVNAVLGGVGQELGTQDAAASAESTKMAKHAEQTVKGMASGLRGHMGIALEAAADMTAQFLAKFDVIISQLPLVARDALTKFVQLFREGMQVALTAAGEMTLDFLGKFEVIIDRLGRIAQEAMARMAEVIAAGLGEITEMVEDGMAAVTDTVDKSMAAVVTETAQAVTNWVDEVERGVAAITEQVDSGLATVVQGVRDDMATLVQTVKAAMADAAEATTTGMQRFVQAVQSGLNTALNAARSTMGQITSAITNGMSQAVSAVQNGMNQLRSAVQSALDQALAAARSFASSFAGAFSGLANQVTPIFQQIVSAAQTTLNPGTAQSIGSNFVGGLVAGINSQVAAAQAAAQQVVNAVATATAAAAQIASPSKRFARMGAFVGEGFSEGLGETMGETGAIGAAAMADLDQALGSGFARTAPTVQAGTTAMMTAFDTGMEGSVQSVRDGVNQVVPMMQNGMSALRVTVEQAIDRILVAVRAFEQTMVSTFTQLTGTLTDAFQRIVNAAQAAFNPATFQSLGAQIGQSFVNGVNSQVAAAQAAVSNLTNLANQAATTSASIAATVSAPPPPPAPALPAPPASSPSAAAQAAANSLRAVQELLRTGDFRGGIFGLHEDDPAFAKLFGFRNSLGSLLNRPDALASLNEVIRLLVTGDFRGGIFGLHEDDPRLGLLFDFRNAIAHHLVAGVKEALGIHSPSRKFIEIGEQILAGLEIGVSRGLSNLIASIVPVHTNTNIANTIGPIHVNTPMDWAELEFRVKRWIAEAV
jgi:TP901 family phage tail tape measure protein